MKYSAFETRVFADVSQALVAAPVDPRRVERFLGDLASRAPWRVAWGLKALLWVAWVAGFSRRDEAGRSAWWERALGHPRYTVRQLALVGKAMVCLCQYDTEGLT